MQSFSRNFSNFNSHINAAKWQRIHKLLLVHKCITVYLNISDKVFSWKWGKWMVPYRSPPSRPSLTRGKDEFDLIMLIITTRESGKSYVSNGRRSFLNWQIYLAIWTYKHSAHTHTHKHNRKFLNKHNLLPKWTVVGFLFHEIKCVRVSGWACISNYFYDFSKSYWNPFRKTFNVVCVLWPKPKSI